jgi:queuine tRNA-ribosyltransferase
VTFKVQYKLEQAAPSGARAGTLTTRRGVTQTPTFMPVATHAHVRNLTMQEVAASGAKVCLANTYHLLMRPGTEVFDRVGGIHPFMKWEHSVLTDSGGFQIFSLPGERWIDEDGARFRSPFDNQTHLLSPESSIATQQSINSDIMMVLDVCVPSTSDEAVTQDAMERTHRWALRSLAQRDSKDTGQAVFAIVQGGVFPHLREQSAAFLTAHPFDGFAIGGLAVGESRELLYSTTRFTARLLPENRPRYLMGVGTPIDLVECVNVGVDMFDCILPGKMAQQSYACTFEGLIRLVRHEYRMSDDPIDPTCGCPVCKTYTRGYLRHLAHGGHTLAARLITEHNLWFYQALMKRMRAAIVENRWDDEYRELQHRLTPPKQIRPLPNTQQGAFELVMLRTGERAVRHTGNGEVMHPVGPWTEANKLYVEQLKLRELLAKHDDEPLRILDVGLGAATNAIAALTCAQEMGGERRRALEIVSLEHDLDALALALTDPQGFPFLTPWKTACEAILNEHEWEAPSLSWRVIKGDAREALDEVEGTFDLIYFDPFSPESNPTLWTMDFARRIHSKARYEGATLATYSAATPTRVMFLLAGFFVGHGVASGTRTESTFASTKLELVPEPLGDRWLQRWLRSTSRGAHDVPVSEEVERRIKEHPQFFGQRRVRKP